jgi:hypothetical protein
MANAFTASRAYRYAGPVGKTLLKVWGTLVIDTTATGGAADNDLPATMFGLTEIIGCAAISNDNDSKGWIGVPSYDGDSLMVTGGASNAYMDLPNDTYKVCIQGYA